MPFNDGHAIFAVKGVGWTSLEPVAGQHILRGLLGHAGKNRPTAGQPHTGCARQVEKIVAIKKHSEHISAADDAKACIGNAEHGQRLVEGSAGRIPEKCVVVVRVACYRRDSPGQNQSFAQIRSPLVFMRVTSVHNYIDAIESALEKVLIGFELERVRHHASRVGKHAVFGDYGISFDTMRCFHGGRNFQMHPRRRQDFATADYIFLTD
jgi:hypothetical protein